MSPINRLTVLAFASAALAVPYAGHGHLQAHQHLHRAPLSGSEAPFPYPIANETGIWGTTGTGAPTTYRSSSQALPETATEQTVQTQTNYRTITVNQAYPTQSNAAGGEGDQCGDVTVTSTEKVYVTITGGEASSSSAEVSAVESSSGRPTSTVHVTQTYQAPGYGSSSSSEAAPASSSVQSSAAGYSAPAYSAPASSSSEASPESTFQSSAAGYSAPAYSAPVSSSTAHTSSSEAAAESPSSSSVVPKYSAPASSSSAASIISASASLGDKGSEGAAATASSYAPASTSAGSGSTSPGSSSGKRGLAYNDASLLSCFSGSDQISWAYNWESASKGLSGYTYIPTLWGNSATYCDSWSDNAKSAISSGSKYLFSFNEPDLPAQANLSPEAAAQAYITHMNPFAGQAKLCAPAVTNGGGDMGLTWLQNFLDACGSDCHIDCLNIHWYDAASNTDYFKSHVGQAVDMGKGKEVFVSEMGATGSNDEIATFLETVMPWMDSNSSIAGYAYYMAADGLLVTGTEPSTYGSTYKTYTS